MSLGQGDNDSRTNLIINYLPQNMSDAELQEMFGKIGPVEKVHIARDSSSGYSYGFGFVDFKYHADAIRAIDGLNGCAIENKRLKVAFARPQSDDNKDTNLYISNLPREVDDAKLQEWFGKFGNIVQKNVLRDKNTGMPKGVAFVRYEKRDEAQAAMNQLNGQKLPGCRDPIVIKVAQLNAKQKANYMANVSGYQVGYNRGPNYSGTGPFTNFGVPQPTGPMRGRRGSPRRFGNFSQPTQQRYDPIGMGGGYDMFA